jgi:hypothetical protein
VHLSNSTPNGVLALGLMNDNMLNEELRCRELSAWLKQIYRALL